VKELQALDFFDELRKRTLEIRRRKMILLISFAAFQVLLLAILLLLNRSFSARHR
jgi:uncharacterized membrane protein YvbJ